MTADYGPAPSVDSVQAYSAQGESTLDDVDPHAPSAGALGDEGAGDRLRTFALPGTSRLDAGVLITAARLARVSPLVARLVADGTYLRAMLGAGALLLPVAGVVLGIVGGLDMHGSAATPAAVILGLIAVVGALDALSGALAMAALIVVMLVTGSLTSADSVRTLMGLAIIAFGPALIAGSVRPMRRGRDDYDGWERLADFVVIPLLGGYIVQNLVSALSGLSGYAVPIVSHANAIAIAVVVALLARVSLEELAARAYPARIRAVAPIDLPDPPIAQRVIAILIRGAVFGFLAAAFIGLCWQLWLGIALFIVGQLVGVIAPLLPNSTTLFHLTPVGVTKIVITLVISLGITTAVTLLIGQGPDLARTSFVLLLLPGFAFAAMGMFGRSPAPGDVRWYDRPSWRTFSRIAGIVLVAAGVWLTQFS